MNKAKIVLFAPEPEKNHYWVRVPISILATASLINEHGYEIIVITSREPDWRLRLSNEVRDALLFGVTAMTGYQITEGLLAAQICKNANPSVPVVFGGWHPTTLPRQTCEHPLVDIVVKGQGERTLLHLAESLSAQRCWTAPSETAKSPLSGINGIVYKSKGGIQENPDIIPEDINNFPHYPYHLIDCNKYICPSEFGKRTLNYISARGCPHKCRFCAEMVMNKRHWAGLNSGRVVDELEFLTKKYNLDSISIDDTNFFVNKKRVIEICEGLLKKGLNIKLGSLSADTRAMLKYEDEVWALMRESGIRGIFIGAEGGGNETLRHVDKDATIEEIIRLVEKCSKYDFKVNLSFMVGYPRTESYNLSIEDQINSILNLLDKCLKTNKLIQGVIHFYTPYPGTIFYRDALINGLREPKSFDEWAGFMLNHSHMPFVEKKHLRLVKCIDFTLQFLFAKFTKTKEFGGYRYTWGKNAFRKFVYALIEDIIIGIASLRWKYKFFNFSAEVYSFEFLLKVGRKLRNIF